MKRSVIGVLLLFFLIIYFSSINIRVYGNNNELIEDAQNLIYDPSFEISKHATLSDGSGIIKSWAHSCSIFGGIDKNTDEAYRGSSNGYFVSNCDGVPGHSVFAFFQDVDVKPYTMYKLTFYAKKWAVNSVFDPEIHSCSDLHYGITNPLLGNFETLTEEKDDSILGTYKKITFTFNSNNLNIVRVILYNITLDYDEVVATGYHFDNFELKEIISNLDNGNQYFKNNSFENSLNNWTISGHNITKMPRVFYNMNEFDYSGDHDDYSYGGWSTESIIYGQEKVYSLDCKLWDIPDPSMYFLLKNGLTVGKTYKVQMTVMKNTDSKLLTPFFWYQYYIDDNSSNTSIKTISFANQINNVEKNEWINVEIIMDLSLPEIKALESIQIHHYDYKKDSALYIKNVTISSYNEDLEGLSIGVSDDDFYEGSNSLYVYESGGNLTANKKSVLSQDVILDKNTVYDLSFFAKKFGNINNGLSISILKKQELDYEVIKEFTYLPKADGFHRINYNFCTGNSTDYRIEIISSSSINDEYAGFYIDLLSLYKISKPLLFDIHINDVIVPGDNEDIVLTANYENNNNNMLVLENDDVFVEYISSNTDVIKFESGRLLALKEGTAIVTAKIHFYNYDVFEINKEVNITSAGDSQVIDYINASLNNELRKSVDFSKINIEIVMGNGTVLDYRNAIIYIEVEDEDIALITLKDDVYSVYGRKAGVTTLHINAIYNGRKTSTEIPINIQDGNYLEDSGFEDPNHSAWNIISNNTEYGFDYFTSGGYACFGRGNAWTRSGVGGMTKIYQDVNLDVGNYTLNALINRFYGIDQNKWGGTAALMVEQIDNGVPLKEPIARQVFDVSYGSGGYTYVETTLTISNEGLYRVSILLEGDKNLGMGFQIDNLMLVKSSPVNKINVFLNETNTINVDDILKLTVSIDYEDGTNKEVTTYSISIDNEDIAKKQGFYIVGLKEGTCVATITVVEYGIEYSESITVKVNAITNDPNMPPDNESEQRSSSNIKLFIGLGVGAIVLSSGLVAAWFIFNKRKTKTKL